MQQPDSSSRDRNSSDTKTILIGGSAGSLSAIRALFESLPASINATLIVVQHLNASHESQLPALIASWTSLPVTAMVDGMTLQSGHVYVGAPGRVMSLNDNLVTIRATEASDPPYKPIDHLCTSLASNFGPNAGLVVLSGTGHDGSEGARAIKHVGGVVLAQSNAEFDGMPSSAIETGQVDLALSPAELALALSYWSRLGTFDRSSIEGRLGSQDEETFAAILAVVSAQANLDMSGYKPNTLRRRIERRVGLCHCGNLQAYLRHLDQNSNEVIQLARDLRIGVTAFFRDGPAFDLIEKQVVPSICEARTAHEPVRVWVAGCSTGEEAYSIAMLLMEWFEQREQTPRIQIFATDIDAAALDVGRAGIYSKDSLLVLPAERLQRYFKPDKNGYRVTKSVRESIIFASHNLISDPPFSRVDLVVCRNVLIYLNTTLQKKLLSLFHFVLKPGGYLFLGGSETIGSVARHFQTVSKQWRIYRQVSTTNRRPPNIPVHSGRDGRRLSIASESLLESPGPAGRERRYHQFIARHGVTQILVSSSYELLFVSGDTAPYLHVPVGQASQDLIKMVRPELSMALRSAVNGAQWNHQRTTASANLGSGAEERSIRIQATPIEDDEGDSLLLVCFSPDAVDRTSLLMTGELGNDWTVRQLSQELSSLHEDLQRTIEQSRIASAEMSAANEEIMAMNEELQSANEELESSKEELQSLNDELAASNTALDSKVIEVEALNTDLRNLLDSTQTATLLLDPELRIRRFTPACTQLMRIISGDVGRAIDDVVLRFNDPGLIDDCRQVLHGSDVADCEIQMGAQQWYLRRILPYRRSDGHVSGAVLTFTDVSTLKEADRLLRERARSLQWQTSLLSNATLFGRDLQDRIIFWTKGAEALYGWSEDEALGQTAHELLRSKFPVPLPQIKSHLFEQGSWRGEIIHQTKNGDELVIDSQWSIYRDETGEVSALVTVANDVTERKLAQRALRKSMSMFHTMLDWTLNWEYWLGGDGKIVYMTPSAERVTGYSVDEFEHNSGLLDAIVFAADIELWSRRALLRGTSHRDEVLETEFRIVRKNGELAWVSGSCRSVIDDEGQHLGQRITIRDISEQKSAEEQIRSLAYFDTLTHLPNRRLLMDRLNHALVASNRNYQFGAVVLLDLDHFKSLNDTRGHDVGDSLLVEVAQRLLQTVRNEDTVARLGGDEFALVLENLGPGKRAAAQDAQLVVEQIRAALGEPYLLENQDAEHHCSASIGLVLFRGNSVSAEVLIRQADVALYQAKDAGRNLSRHFDPAMQSVIDSRVELTTALYRGLERREFVLHYQPQVDLQGRLIGAEALIRWQRSADKLVSPDQFIPLAEETGLILPIGRWVLDSACEQLKLWAENPRTRHLNVAVNVSAKQFHRAEFVDDVKNSLSRSGVDPARLKLELTESVVLDGVDEVIARMHELMKFGVQFALDDFGTGYSSLSYLKRLPLWQLKIDQAFVRTVTQDRSDAAIVQAILSMSQSLGIQVIAEGVETTEQYAFLEAAGCRAFQGYLFGKPMLAADWGPLLDSSAPG